MSSADPDQREEAARELQAFLPEEAVIDALIELLGDADWRVRRASVESILTVVPQLVMPRILQCLYDEDNAGRRNAAIDLLNRFGKTIVPHIELHLKSRNRDVQMFLIQLLGDLRDRTYLDEITRAVEDKEDNVASAAILALGKIGDPVSLPIILRLLQNDDPWIQFQAIEAAGEMRDPGILPELIRLRDSPYCRKQILKALGKFQDPEAYRTLIRSLFAEKRLNPDALEALFCSYSEFQPAPLKNARQKQIRKEFREQTGEEQVQVLIREFENASPGQKKRILEMLGWSRSTTGIPLLMEHLSDPEFQESAAGGLADCGEAAAEILLMRLRADPAGEELAVLLVLLNEMQIAVRPEELEKLLGHPSAEVRLHAYRLLIRSAADLPEGFLLRGVLDANSSVHDACLQPLLARCLDHEEVRARILEEMGVRLHAKIASEREAALEFVSLLERGKSGTWLVPALKDPNPVVRRKAAAVMQSVYDVSFRRPLIAALTDEDGRVRELAVRAMGQDLSEEAGDALLSATRDESLWVRLAAYESLAANPSGNRIAAALRERLHSENPAACAVLLRCLAAIPGSISNTFILQYTQSGDPEIRKSACEALSSSADAVADSGIEQALLEIAERDPDWKVRAAALQTFLRIRPARAIQILHSRWNTERHPYVRKHVLRFLREAKTASLPSDLLSCLLDPDLADDAYEFLLSSRDQFRGILREASLSQPPAIRRILQSIAP